MLQTISSTQQPGKTAPELYQLLLMYLNKISSANSPQAIVGSFRLKLMRYEGTLALLSHCCACAQLLEDTWIHQNEAFCHSHSPVKDLLVTKEEREQVEVLAFSRDFTVLATMNMAPILSKKIRRLFDESLET